MKLAALIAGLALVGCADLDNTTGGMGEGVAPYKLSDTRVREAEQFDATQVVQLKQKLGTTPADAICEGCVMTSYSVVDLGAGLDEVRIVTDGGMPICKIFLNDDGIVVDECGWFRP